MHSGPFNPVLTSMRGLCAASHLERVQKDDCGREVSLGSFSEAQAVFDQELPEQVFLDLSAEIPVSWGDARPRHLAAMPRLHWALGINDQNRTARLLLKFSVLRQAACDTLITTGNSCGREALRESVKKGEIIVGDRYHGLEYGFSGEFKKPGTSCVIVSATSRAWKSSGNFRRQQPAGLRASPGRVW